MPKIVVDINDSRSESSATYLGQVPGYEGQAGWYFKFSTQAIEGGGIEIRSENNTQLGGSPSTDGGQGGSGQGGPFVPPPIAPPPSGTGGRLSPDELTELIEKVFKEQPPPDNSEIVAAVDSLANTVDQLAKRVDKMEQPGDQPAGQSGPRGGSIRIPVSARVIQKGG